MSLDILLLVQLLATVGMTAVIWFVQIAHYPLHMRVPEQGFAAYQQAHMYRVTFVVGPLMLVEAAAASWLLLMPLPENLVWLAWVGFAMVLLVWISTACLQVPCHHRLERGYDLQALRRLLATNWIRTGLWTGRAVIAVMMCVLAWHLGSEQQGHVI